jgi:LmbE family N-acetylglucosaminyl deacetylase
MKAVVLVAHPDDCVIFAWPFIEAHTEFEWRIVYLTHQPYEPRAREMRQYWARRNIVTEFLGFDDNWSDTVDQHISFDQGQAIEAIKQSADADLILTHFEDGDYGHIHHKFVNAVAKQIDRPKVYFASTFNYNVQYTVTDPVAVEELPLHRSVIEQFHDRNIGRYILTPEAELILKEKQ